MLTGTPKATITRLRDFRGKSTLRISPNRGPSVLLGRAGETEGSTSLDARQRIDCAAAEVTRTASAEYGRTIQRAVDVN